MASFFETALSFFFEMCPGMIQLYFISNNNNDQVINGFGLALVIFNCIGQGLYYGLCTGLETISSHAFGAKNYFLVGNLLYRCLFVEFIMFFPIFLSMFYAKYILSLWISNIYICEIAQLYCRLCIPSIAFSGIFFSLKAFLNS